MDEIELKPCPFCGDQMMWIEDAPAFTHTAGASDVAIESARCFLRHSHFHAEQIAAWNTRATADRDAVIEECAKGRCYTSHTQSRQIELWIG